MIWFLKMMLGAAAIFVALIGGAVLFSNLISFFVPNETITKINRMLIGIRKKSKDMSYILYNLLISVIFK